MAWIVVENADGEPVGAEELPDVLDGVQFGSVGRQLEEGDVRRHDQLAAAVPACAVEHKHRVRAGRHGAGDLSEMGVHRLGVGKGQHEAGRRAAGRADGTEDVGPLVSGVARRARPRAALRPDTGEGAPLADARLVLEPDLERLAPGRFRQDRRTASGKFL